MSEPMGITITIGGSLRGSLLQNFFNAIKDDLDDIIGYTSKENIAKETDPTTGLVACNTWNATANWGNCDDLKAFCVKHNLPYNHHCESNGEYNASIEYWLPGMKDPIVVTCDAEGHPVLNAEAIRPYLNMLISLVKGGLEQLPLMIHDEVIGTVVSKMLKSKKPYDVLEKEINRILPVIPHIPDLIIV